MDEYNIDYSHFTGRARQYNIKEVPIEEYLNNNKPIQTAKLKNKLLKLKIKENKCECCGITEWNRKPLVMQLHHINGNHLDNKLENLQMLCPNCHSQTENYCGNAQEEKHYYCKDCGKEISRGATYCTLCNAKHHRKVELPSKEQLIEDFKEIRSFSGVGRKYGVTDNTIRKWFSKYNLPNRSNELKEYIENI